MRGFLLTLFLWFWAAAASAQVYINEVDYDQPGTDNQEFIELIGPSGGSLNGYTIELVNGSATTPPGIYRTVDLTGLFIPNDNVAGYGFLVIGNATVPNVDFTPSGWPNTDAIQNGAPDGILLKLNGVVVDGFSYEGVLTINPEFTAGMAITAQETNASPNLSVGRMTLGFDPNNQNQYFAADAHEPSPGAQNSAHGQVLSGDPPPVINGASITRTPKIPNANQNTIVTAEVTDNSEVTLVELRYRVNDGAQQAVTMVNTSGDIYSGEIPESAYDDADRVEYWIYAEDDFPQGSESAHFKFFAGDTPIFDLHAAGSNGVLLYLGYDARVTGVATVAHGVFSTTNLDVYIQDASGGINVFAFGLNPGLTITVGNSYTVTGAVAQFNGKTEIIPADQLTEIIDNGPAVLPGAVVKTIAEFLADPETYEGMLVAIAQVTNTGAGNPWPAAGSNANVEITDDGGISRLIMRIDADTDIDGSPEPSWPVNVRGIFTQFDNTGAPLDTGYQVQPRSLEDIDIILGVEPGSGGDLVRTFKLHGNYPNPFNPATTLRFDVPPSGQTAAVELVVYNTLGQKIAVLVNEKLAAGRYEVQWNGRSDTGAVLPSGVYFAVLSWSRSEQQVAKMILMK